MQKLGSLIIDVAGLELTSEDREILAHPLVGGTVLFTRNYHSREQLTQLCQQIHSIRKTPLLIMVDQEGGRVQRFINEFTRLPYMATFGKIYAANPALALEKATHCGWLMATELLTAGVDLSLAPVLDLNKGISSIIGERAFHADPAVVIELAAAFITGMREAGMAAVGKHFPGHGSVTLDSHVAIPIDNRLLPEIESADMVPFASLINQGIAAIMVAHIIFPQVDSVAVGFSKHWLRDILRIKLGFQGAIFSDDLNMEGANISTHFVDRVVAAREAGCDFALLCNNRQASVQVIDSLPYKDYLVDNEKWSVLRGQNRVCLQDNKRWQKAYESILTDI